MSQHEIYILSDLLDSVITKYNPNYSRNSFDIYPNEHIFPIAPDQYGYEGPYVFLDTNICIKISQGYKCDLSPEYIYAVTKTVFSEMCQHTALRFNNNMAQLGLRYYVFNTSYNIDEQLVRYIYDNIILYQQYYIRIPMMMDKCLTYMDLCASEFERKNQAIYYNLTNDIIFVLEALYISVFHSYIENFQISSNDKDIVVLLQNPDVFKFFINAFREASGIISNDELIYRKINSRLLNRHYIRC